MQTFGEFQLCTLLFSSPIHPNMSDSDFYLKTARYGKDLVRFMRVYRDGKVQRCAELTVRLLLEGDIETSYTKADNSVVVATGNDDIHDF